VTSKLASFVCLRIDAYTLYIIIIHQIFCSGTIGLNASHDTWYLSVIPQFSKLRVLQKNIWGIIHVNLVLKAHSFHCSLLRTVQGQLSKHMFVSNGDFFIYNMTVPDITPWYHLISQWILQHQQVLCKLVISHCHHSLPNKWSKLQICINKYVRFW